MARFLFVVPPLVGHVNPTNSVGRELERAGHEVAWVGHPGTVRKRLPEGARLITKYSKLYLKTAKTIIPPEDFVKFVKYCAHDVRMEQSMSDYLGDLPERELEIFQLYLRVSMRGLHLDKKGINAATDIVDQRAKTLTAEFRALTGLNPTQGKKLLVWFGEQGLPLENMQAA